MQACAAIEQKRWDTHCLTGVNTMTQSMNKGTETWLG